MLLLNIFFKLGLIFIFINYLIICVLAYFTVKIWNLKTNKAASRLFFTFCVIFAYFIPSFTNDYLSLGSKPPETKHILGKQVAYSFQTLEGDTLSLDSLCNKIVLIECWATWCKPCIALLPDYKKVYNKYQNNKYVVFLSVNIDGKKDTVEKIKAFKSRHNIQFPVYRDTARKFLTHLQLNSIPATIVLKNNIVQRVVVGIDPDKNYYDEIGKTIDTLLLQVQ